MNFFLEGEDLIFESFYFTIFLLSFVFTRLSQIFVVVDVSVEVLEFKSVSFTFSRGH